MMHLHVKLMLYITPGSDSLWNRWLLHLSSCNYLLHPRAAGFLKAAAGFL